MHPILFRWGPLTLYTYGLLMALAFLSGLLLATRQAEKEGIEPQLIIDLSFYLIMGALVGSRLFFVLLNYPYYSAHPLAIFQIWEGGLVFYGGLLGAAFTSAIYIRIKGLPFWQLADVFAPSIALGQAIGRWGCFFAGCCYGRPTDLPWAVVFHHPKSLAPLDLPLHPVQLYSSAKDLVIFLFLIWQQRKAHPAGQLFWTYLLLYSGLRFIVEFFRGDPRPLIFGGPLSLTQGIGLVLFSLALIMLFRWRSGPSLTKGEG